MNFEKSTYTIFKNRKISFEKKDLDDYRFVKANEDIDKYELLLVEHVITKDNMYKLASHIKFDDDLLINLYPRNKTDDICEKVQKNAFDRGDNIYFLGKDISLFNHSTNPNCIVSYYNILIPDLEFKETIIYVYSYKKIIKEEELFIYYGKNYFGDKEEHIINYIDSGYLAKNIINKYIEKEIYKKIMFNHVCAYYGIYFNNNNIVITPRAKETIKEDYNIWILKKKLSMGIK